MIKPLCLFILDMRIENIFQSILYVSFNFALSSQPHTQSPDQEQQAAPESQQLSPGMLLTCLFPAVLHLRALPFSSLVAALLMSPCAIKLKKIKRVQSDKAGKHPSSCPGTAVQTKVEGGFRSAGRAPCIARGFSAAVGKVTFGAGRPWAAGQGRLQNIMWEMVSGDKILTSDIYRWAAAGNKPGEE